MIVGLSLAAVAEVAARLGWVSPLILPAPSEVMGALWDGIIVGGVYLEHTLSTLAATAIGFLSSAVVAVVSAGLLTSISRLERILLPFIVGLQTLPKAALAPLLLLWLGFGQIGKITIVALVSFFPMLVNALQGMRLRDEETHALFRSLGSSKYELFRYLRLPSSMPYVFAGLHIGVVFALIGAVVAELLGAEAGLGYILLQEQALFNMAGVFGILLILLLIGLSLHGIMRVLEKRIAFWTASVADVTAA